MISLIVNTIIFGVASLLFTFALMLIKDIWKLSKWLFSKIKSKKAVKAKEKPDEKKKQIFLNAIALSALEIDEIDQLILMNHFGDLYQYTYLSRNENDDFYAKQTETGHLLITDLLIEEILNKPKFAS